MVSHPFQRVPPGKLRYLIVPLATLTAVLLGAMLLMPGPGDLPALVGAGTPSRAQAILARWTELDRIQVAWKNGFDYFLMAAFSNLLGLASIWASRQSSSALFACIGATFAWLAWVSIVLDVPENVAYLAMVRGSVQQPWPALSAVCFYTKSFFQASTAVYLSLGLAHRLVGPPGAAKRAGA